MKKILICSEEIYKKLQSDKILETQVKKDIKFDFPCYVIVPEENYDENEKKYRKIIYGVLKTKIFEGKEICFIKFEHEVLDYESDLKTWLYTKNIKSFFECTKDYKIRKKDLSETEVTIAKSEVPSRFESPREDLLKKMAQMNAPLLLLGERGTGKNTLVEKIFSWKQEIGLIPSCATLENNKVEVVCGSLTDNLQKSELFGHKKGAFTGAIDNKKGYLEKANGGLLYLDEIQDLSKSTQRLLIEAIRRGKFYNVGEELKEVSFQLVCASNKPLEELLQKLDFDFYDRISTFQYELMPLRKILEEKYSLEEIWKCCWNNYKRDKDKVDMKNSFPQEPIDYDKVKHAIEHSPLRGNYRDINKLISYIDLLIYNQRKQEYYIPENKYIKKACELWIEYYTKRDNAELNNYSIEKRDTSILFTDWFESEFGENDSEHKMNFEQILKSNKISVKHDDGCTKKFKRRLVLEAKKYGSNKEVAEWLDMNERSIRDFLSSQ